MTIQQIIYSMANSAMPNEENAKLAVVFICVLYACNAPRSLLAPPPQRWLLPQHTSHRNATHRKCRRCTLTRQTDQNPGPAQPARWSSSTKALVQLNQEYDPAGSFLPSITPYIIGTLQSVSLSLSVPLDQWIHRLVVPCNPVYYNWWTCQFRHLESQQGKIRSKNVLRLTLFYLNTYSRPNVLLLTWNS
jgi:hypothetical protein